MFYIDARWHKGIIKKSYRKSFSEKINEQNILRQSFLQTEIQMTKNNNKINETKSTKKQQRLMNK